jgi:hypothetical protein
MPKNGSTTKEKRPGSPAGPKNNLDDIDYAILRIMQENCNRTYTYISTMLKKQGIDIK